MANGKRGFRHWKAKDPDYTSTTTDPSTSIAKNMQAIDADQGGDAAISARSPQQPDIDQKDEVSRSTASVQVPVTAKDDVDDKTAQSPKHTRGQSDFFNEDYKKLAIAERLKASEHRISDLEMELYRKDDSLQQQKKAQKKARSEDTIKLKEQERHIQRLEEEMKSKDDESNTMARKSEIRLKSMADFRTKLEDAENRSSQDSIELQKATARETALTIQSAQQKKELQRVREDNARLIEDNNKLRNTIDSTSDLTNDLITKQYSAQEDAERKSEVFQHQKEELQEMKRHVMEQCLLTPRDLGSEESSKPRPMMSMRERHQPRRALSYELEGMPSDGDNDNLESSDLRSQSQTSGPETTASQYIPVQKPQSLFFRPLPKVSENTTSLFGAQGSLRQSAPSFLSALGHPATPWSFELAPRASTQKKPAAQKDAITQTDRSTRCDVTQNMDQATMQNSPRGKIPFLGSMCYEHWFFIIAACLMLLFTIFAFYHGLQAKAERNMWVAANDFSRRAVIYQRNASLRGQSVGWLTTARMKSLGNGCGTKFGKYGVEM